MTEGHTDSVLSGLLGPSEQEVTCETCFEELDRYVECKLDGADADRAIPGMFAHLQGCPACREDYESLLALTDASDATTAR